MPGIQAVILASGFSRRLGVDKLSQDLCGKSVLQRVVENVLGTGIEKIVVVIRERDQAKLIHEDPRISILFNDHADQGMSSSIKLAILRADPESHSFLFLNGDMPFFSTESIIRLLDLWKRNPDKIACVKSNEVLRGPVIFPKKFTRELLGLEGENGGREILTKNPEDTVSILIDDPYEIVDIDDREDLEKARETCRNLKVSNA